MSENHQMKKTAISVYDPSDPWEAAIQDAAKRITGQWLPSYPCQLLARTISSLKSTTEWIEQKELLPIRASYFFAPHLAEDKQNRVFVTHLLYLRDILENRHISSVLHGPIAFMTKSLAYFLFRDSPVHIGFHEDLLRSHNKKAELIDVGGLLIAPEDNILFDDDTIAGVRYYGESSGATELIHEIKQKSHLPSLKVAATEIAPDVFEISEHFREIRPGSLVWDKVDRTRAEISGVEPGENGMVAMEYASGRTVTICKEDFDRKYVIIKA